MSETAPAAASDAEGSAARPSAPRTPRKGRARVADCSRASRSSSARSSRELKKVVRPDAVGADHLHERRARVRRGGHGLRHRGRPGHRQAHVLGLRRLTPIGLRSPTTRLSPHPGRAPTAPARRGAHAGESRFARVAGVAGAHHGRRGGARGRHRVGRGRRVVGCRGRPATAEDDSADATESDDAGRRGRRGLPPTRPTADEADGRRGRARRRGGPGRRVQGAAPEPAR